MSVTIDTRAPVLEEADDGASKISLNLINLTDGDLQVGAEAQHRTACVPKLDKTKLDAAGSTAVVITLPATCKASEGLTLDIVATAGSVQVASFPVTPEVKPVKEPQWHELRAFGYAWAGIVLLLCLFFWKGWNPAAGAERSPFQRLYLDATWKFNDNWATNVSAVGAILTGVFGATTAKAFLGEDAESAVALATVGAAIALALVAAGPVVALATKTFKVMPVKGEDGKVTHERWDAFTVGGLLLAASVIFASGFGQLWVVMATGEELELGGLQDWLFIPFGIAGLLLFAYGWRSLKDLLQRGTEKPEKDDSDEIKAAKLIAAAIVAKVAVPEGKPPAAAAAADLSAAVAALEGGMADQEAIAGDAYVQRQRSVLP